MNTFYKSLFVFGFFWLVLHNTLTAQIKDINITYKYSTTDKNFIFSYEKRIPGTYMIYFKFTQLENAFDPYFSDVIDSNTGTLFTLKPIDSKHPIRFSYQFSYIMGTTFNKADSMFVYTLPFKQGHEAKPYEMSYLWKQYMNKVPPKNWKAFMFVSNKADTVCAARKGIVVKIDVNKDPDSLITRYHSNANTILVQHADGTLADYTGFAKNGNFVKEGDTVYPQTPLGVLGYYDAQKDYQLRFAIFHLSGDKPQFKEDRTMENMKCYYEYINPVFLTTDGTTRLTKGKKYIAEVNEKTLTAEMTKHEKKKRQNQLTVLEKK
jgi:Peptidase family M23.